MVTDVCMVSFTNGLIVGRSILKYEKETMYELLIALVVVLFAVIKGREKFGLVVGTPDIVTTDTNTDKGYEIFSTWPNTCPPHKSDLDAGLCYEKCRPGYHGVGPVCWADSVNVGVGKPVGLNPCPEGWNNDGLICREPIYNDCSWKWLGVCWGKLRGGRLRGRLNPYCPKPKRKAGDGYDTSDGDCVKDPKNPKSPPYPKTLGVCVGEGALSQDHPDYVAGLCYKECPPNLPERIPGMPYLCYKGGPLSYGRGVGIVPSVLRIGRVWNPF
jgi:hypothetical protein